MGNSNSERSSTGVLDHVDFLDCRQGMQTAIHANCELTAIPFDSEPIDWGQCVLCSTFVAVCFSTLCAWNTEE